MKFVDKTGAIYRVEKDNEVFVALKEIDKNITLIREIEEHELQSVVEASLFNYAKENHLVPEFAVKIRDDSALVFQGEVIAGKDHIKLTNDEIVEKVQEYFELMETIKSMASERDKEVKEIKTTYNDRIANRKDTMEELEPIVRTGLEEIECDVSWERDVDSEMMVLIRRDTLKALQCRPMTAEEKQKNDLLEPKTDQNETEQADKETDEAFNNDTVPEPESGDEEEQTDQV